jgi:hypothetical protein
MYLLMILQNGSFYERMLRHSSKPLEDFDAGTECTFMET